MNCFVIGQKRIVIFLDNLALNIQYKFQIALSSVYMRAKMANDGKESFFINSHQQ